MTRSPQETIPLWNEFLPQLNTQPIKQPLSVDICVIGAGIAGLTTAYMLQKAGKSVAVLDAWDLAAGETGRTTAHLTAILDARYYQLEKLHGKDNARLVAESHMAAINRIEAIAREEHIDCEFSRLNGYLVANGNDEAQLKKELEALHRVGMSQASLVLTSPLGKTLPALQIDEQAQFNPALYIGGLAKAFLRDGGLIFNRSPVQEVKGGKEAYVKTEDGVEVKAKALVIATHTPVNDLVTMHTKQAAYRSYVIGLSAPNDIMPPSLVWDTQEPYHYVRLVPGKETCILLVGGEDHKTGQTDDVALHYEKLEAWARDHFPKAGTVKYRWSGQVMEPVDQLAFIGRNPSDKDNVYIATGFSGNGMTYGTMAGIILNDLIMGRDNAWAKIYDPSRKSLKAAPAFIEENANVVACMTRDWVKGGEVDSLAELKAGQGAVLQRGMHKIAAYRDEHGVVHERSAVCTHLKCIVQWNAGEKSWDCPCHGSRFDCHGQVLNGPALYPLEEAPRMEEGEQYIGVTLPRAS